MLYAGNNNYLIIVYADQIKQTGEDDANVL